MSSWRVKWSSEEKELNKFSIGRVLGKGSFGKVYVCSLEGKEYAMKVLDKTSVMRKKSIHHFQVKDPLKEVYEEIEILTQLYHRNILLLFQVIDLQDSIYLITEYLPHGELCRYTTQFEPIYDETQIQGFISDIAHGLLYLHQKDIAHRDVKPSNILLDEHRQCVLIDFGSAMQHPKLRKDTVGTFPFLPPEALTGEPYCPILADVWALGITMYVLLFHQLPYQHETPAILFDRILHHPIPLPSNTYSAMTIQTLSNLLSKQPTTRLPLSQIPFLEHRSSKLGRDSQ